MKKKKIAAIIQARMGSTRLPGKVLKEVGKKPILEILIERLKKSKYLDEIIIATSENQIDDRIIELSENLGIKWFRGSENDVLDRYLKASEKFNVDIIVRVTSDNPLTDVLILDKLVKKHIKYGSDYTYPTNIPLGVGVEVINKSALKESSINAKNEDEREHVTVYIKSNPQKFRINKINLDLNCENIRVTVDTFEDLKVIECIYNKKGSLENLNTDDLIDFFEKNPGISTINKNIKQVLPKSVYNPPLISVIIRTHNSSNYVKKSLDSVLNQALPSKFYEVIVVDDGSTDNTIDILKEYDNRIVIIKENLLNAIKALNKGLNSVNGEFFIILDSDDTFEFEALMDFFSVIQKDSDIDFIYSDYYEINIKKNSKKLVSLKNNVFNSIAGGIAFRKSVIKDLGGYDENLLFPEYDLLIKLIKNKYKSKYIQKPLYNYFRHDSSITADKNYVKKGLEQLYRKHGEIKGLRNY